MPQPDPTRHAILDVVHRQLSIDEPWTHRDGDRAFTWWPGLGLRQHVRADGPLDVDGVPTWWLTIETPVWRGADPVALAPWIEQLRVQAHGAAVVHAPGSDRVSLVTRAYLMPETVTQQGMFFAGLGPVQLRLAHWAWQEAEARLGARAAAWRDTEPHPLAGERAGADEILALPERVLQPGAARMDAAARRELVRSTAGGLAAAAVGPVVRELDDGVWFGVDAGAHEGLLMVGILDSPLVGASLALSLMVDGAYGEAEGRALCHELQRRMLTPPSLAWTLGAWVLRPRPKADGDAHMPLHTLFVPLGLIVDPRWGLLPANGMAQALRALRDPADRPGAA